MYAFQLSNKSIKAISQSSSSQKFKTTFSEMVVSQNGSSQNGSFKNAHFFKG